MAKFLARHHKFEVNTGTDAAPTWVEIKGIAQYDWSSKRDNADTTSFDDNGVKSHIPASLSYECKLEGKAIAGDAGQEAVEALEDQIEDGALAQFKITNKKTGKTKTFMASAQIDMGGGADEAMKWNCTLTVSGAVTKGTVAV